MARAAALKEKHTLQLEETKLKSKMEQMELEVDLVASTANIKILQSDEVDQEAPGDGMNEYYNSHHEPETMESNVDFVQLGAVPKTPLHQTILSLHRAPPTRGTNTPENKPQNKNLTEKHKTKTANHNRTITHAAQDNLDVVIRRQNDIAELIVSDSACLGYQQWRFLCLMVTHWHISLLSMHLNT